MKYLLLLFSSLIFLSIQAQPRVFPKSLAPLSLVITNVNIIDGTGAPIKTGWTILIESNKIKALGPTGSFLLPAKAKKFDAQGKFVIPGLWDMHVHIWNKELFFPLFLANGVLGVRDMSMPLAKIKLWQKESKQKQGPHIIASGGIVDGPKPIWPGSFKISNPEEGRRIVQHLKKEGADFIKIYSLLSPKSYLAIADEAKKQNIPIAGHVPYAVRAQEASEQGQKSIEHFEGILLGCSAKETELRKKQMELAKGYKREISLQSFFQIKKELSQKLLSTYSESKAQTLFQLFQTNQTWQVPTLTVLRAVAYNRDPKFAQDPRLKYIPSWIKTSIWSSQNSPYFKHQSDEEYILEGKVYQKHLQLISTMKQQGVSFLVGTDTPNPYCFPGFSVHDELALLVEGGLSPMEAIQSATLNPAKYLGKTDVFGTIEKNKMADLVLLAANPLQDIRNTTKITAVIFQGKLLEQSTLEEMLKKQIQPK